MAKPKDFSDKKTEEVKDVKGNSRSRNNKHRSNNSKPKAGAAEGYKTTKGTNDLSWHTPDAELLRRAAETSWSYQTGEIMDMGVSIMPDGLVTQNSHASQAGFMVIRDWITCGGIGMRNPAAWQQTYALPTYNAANTLLTEMRSRARIRNTYDAPDVFILNMAMANIYAAITFASRLAATVRSFTYKNQYFPEALIRAQGFNPDWMKGNQFRFVTELNVLISEVNKIYVPNRMHLFELISKRFGNYYTEGSDVRDQVYMFTPAFLSAIDFNPTTDFASHIAPIMCIPGTVSSNFASGTKYSANALYTGDQLLNAIRFMINKVIEHDSTADITGDMENCFGPSERFYLPAVDPMAIVVPVMDEEILETIHNMAWSHAVSLAYTNFDTTASPFWAKHGPFTVFQNPADNRIGGWDYFEVSNTVTNRNYYNSESCVHTWLDVHADPNAEKTFAITRLKNANISRTEYGANFYSQISFTTDLVCSVEFYTLALDANNKPELTKYVVDNLIDPSSANFVETESNIQAFHYRPIRGYIDSSNKLVNKAWVAGETDIWAKCDYFMLQNMNRISLLTLLGAYNNM